MVRASGELAVANTKVNCDLRATLKGSLSNVSILTSFKTKTFKPADIWGGVTSYLSESMFDTFYKPIRSACEFVHNETDRDTYTMLEIGYGFGCQAVTCLI